MRGGPITRRDCSAYEDHDPKALTLAARTPGDAADGQHTTTRIPIWVKLSPSSSTDEYDQRTMDSERDMSKAPEPDPDVQSKRTGYGPDWVSLDRKAMRDRRAELAQRDRDAMRREAERQERLAAENQQVLASDELFDAGERRPANPATPAVTDPKPHDRPRPTALVHQLDLENLRSLSGRHEVPLAPLTLIYGPNAAGKSTLLKALQTFMKVVDAGRRDALGAWDSVLEDHLWTQISYIDPIRDDASGDILSVERPRLALGVEYETRDGELARAEVEYEMSYLAETTQHASTIGLKAEGELLRKEFALKNPLPFVDEGDFGQAAFPSFDVREQDANGAWVTESRVFDPELFAGVKRPLKADLFSMAFLMRYLGPHRGAPGSEYEPMQGRFNTGWMDGYNKGGIAGYNEYELLNQMMSQLDIPYEFEGEPAATIPKSYTRKWSMKDVRSGAPVKLDHVGYGVSQLLPVIDVCIHAYKQVICIEEPELHLHPRVQSRLANLFAFSVLNRGNQVILETHSESILLRVRRLIRTGKLRPDEVELLYVDNDARSGATVRRLQLGAQGELLDPWPSGFFDDTLEDVLGGWE